MSVFVPVAYCLDDCGFVVEPEVRQVDSSSSILSQDCFGYGIMKFNPPSLCLGLTDSLSPHQFHKSSLF